MAMSATQLLPEPVKLTEMSRVEAAGLAMPSTSSGTLPSLPDKVATKAPEMEQSQPNWGSGAVQDPSSMVAPGS